MLLYFIILSEIKRNWDLGTYSAEHTQTIYIFDLGMIVNFLQIETQNIIIQSQMFEEQTLSADFKGSWNSVYIVRMLFYRLSKRCCTNFI
jgi:hypothetical protein